MDRIIRHRANNNGRFDTKDGQDAVGFWRKCMRANNNRTLKIAQMMLVSYLIGKDARTLIRGSAGVLQTNYIGFSSEVIATASEND